MATQKAIIHAATRVIRRLTIDDVPDVAADELAIPLASPIDIGGGPYKLDGANQKIAATLDEIRQAGMDPDWTRAQRLARLTAIRDRLDEIISDTSMPARLRGLCQAMRVAWFD